MPGPLGPHHQLPDNLLWQQRCPSTAKLLWPWTKMRLQGRLQPHGASPPSAGAAPQTVLPSVRAQPSASPLRLPSVSLARLLASRARSLPPQLRPGSGALQPHCRQRPTRALLKPAASKWLPDDGCALSSRLRGHHMAQPMASSPALRAVFRPPQPLGTSRGCPAAVSISGPLCPATCRHPSHRNLLSGLSRSASRRSAAAPRRAVEAAAAAARRRRATGCTRSTFSETSNAGLPAVATTRSAFRHSE